MARLKPFNGKLMVHKHCGNRWTVRTNRDEDDEVFNWLTEHFGEEDFEHGPWAKVSEGLGWADIPTYYDITSREIVVAMTLRWA